MVNWIFYSILIMPWIVIPLPTINDPFRMPKEAFFDIVMMGIIAFGFKNGVKFNYRNKYLMGFSLWTFITVIYNLYIPSVLSFNGKALLNIWAIQPAFHFIFALFASWICLSTLEMEDFRKLARAVCISAVLITVFGILQVINLDPAGGIFKYRHGNHFVACLDNCNIVGNYLALSLPLFLLFIKDKKYIFGFFLIVAGLLISKTFLASLSVIVGLFILLILLNLKHKKKLLALILSFIIFLSVGGAVIKNRIQSDGLSQRVDCWKLTYNTYFKNNPFFGQGMGIFKTWEQVPKPEIETKWFSVHNDYFERAVEIGLLGLFLFVLVIINALRRFNYSFDNLIGLYWLGSFITCLVLMMGTFLIETAPLAFVGLIGWWAVEKM